VTDPVTAATDLPMRPETRAVLLCLVLAPGGACSDGTLPAPRSPDDPASPTAAEAPFAQPLTTDGAPAPPAPPAASGTTTHLHHHEASPVAPADAGAGDAR
jgi:hypothetical protein